LNEVVHDVQHLLKKNQQIRYTHTGSSDMVNLDSSMVKHIVTNLLSNAIKFSGDESKIDLHSECKGKKIILSVTDHGLGIPEEDLDKLFNRFFRSSNVTNIQGTGLGLHIVSKYTELMNGKITCNSRLGEGTTFTITFANN
jgi:signal transduction histidine kinase